jgi:hypothetical protein
MPRSRYRQWCDQYLDAAQWTQLQAVIRAARRDASRRVPYGSRQRTTRVPREHEPFYGVFEPHTRGVYVNDLDNIAGVSALLDSLLSSGR